MKRVSLIKNVTDYFFRYRLMFFLTVLCLFTGTVIGSLSSMSVEGERFDALGTYIKNFLSAYTIQPVSRSEIFVYSIYGNIKVLLFLWVSGLWVGLIPVGLLQPLIKGYKIGFTAAFIVQLYGGRGVVFALASLLPQVLIMVPALVFYTVFNINFALELRKIRMRGISPGKEHYLRNFLMLLIVMAFFVVCSLIDACIVPTVLKPVSLFLKG